MEYLELLETVEDLNSEMFDTHGEVEYNFFLTTNGSIHIIGYGDTSLWVSCDDDRETIEDDYEPLKPFIKRKLRLYADLLLKVSC